MEDKKEEKIETIFKKENEEKFPLPLGEIVSENNDNYEIAVDLDEIQKVVESDKFQDYLLNNATTMGTIAYITQKILTAVAEDKANDAIERVINKQKSKEEVEKIDE